MRLRGLIRALGILRAGQRAEPFEIGQPRTSLSN
jgi:hypothetical protein